MRRAVFWTAVVVAAAALFAGSLYAFVAYRETSGPDGAVRGYFAALERGDAPAALGFGDVPRGPTDLLTDQVLAEQQAIAPMHDAQVLAVAEHGDRADVQFSYHLRFADGDQQYRGVLHVIKRDTGWRLASTVVATRIDLQQAVDRLNFAGTTVPGGRVLMFPGALPIRFDTRYLRLDPSTRSVQFTGSRRTDVRVQPTPPARRVLAAHLRSQLRRCVRSAALACPLPSPQTIPGSLRGRIAKINCEYRVTSEAAGSISISGSAFFVGRYRTLSYENVAATHRGRLALPVSAQTYPVAPLRVSFGGSS
ncbi:MAG TPA: hypothetical protein VGH43_02765 [Jatrophihabitans sp.]